jgi:succinate-semialdehyde dehydrogenase/glutarate-semialdehyde dehydrogenase
MRPDQVGRTLWMGNVNIAVSGRRFAVEDPATLEVIFEAADGDATDAVAAVDRAASALEAWSRTAPRRRADILHRTYELMLRDRVRLADLICLENGKSRADASAEIGYAAEFFRWFSEEAVRPGGDFGSSPAGGTRTIVTHRPVGVVALITPWNFPAAMATRKIAPALAAGCTAVLKPAAETPMTALAILELLAEAGMPDGVIEVVTTTDAESVVSTWLEDPRVRKVSFTGSTQIGKHLLRKAADRVLNVSMELGGNAPFIVLADADINAAVDAAMIAKFRNGGQACTAANRLYVHEAVLPEFVGELGARVKRLKVGRASDDSEVGPLISANAVDRVTRAVDLAVQQGARVTHQADRGDAPGHFYPPTILVDVNRDAAIIGEEIFAPIAPIVSWTFEDDLLQQVNGTEFGLSAYVFAGDVGKAIQLGERIEAGMVGINRGLVSDPSAPFGGVKQSGLGREGARDGLREFQEVQYLSVAWPS